jgi:uncharacterized protein
MDLMQAGPGPSEWPASLDVEALLAGGFRPTPFREFVLKIASRCDLACTYCYMYEMADQSWRDQPVRMSPATLTRTAERIAEHAAAYDLRSVRVVLHGGEPLLVGPAGIAFAATTLRAALPPSTALDLRAQTNGLGLTDEMADTLAAHQITVGISVDGHRRTHDRNRRRPNGAGSYDLVRRGVHRLLDRHPAQYAGLLCAIDVASDPIEVYDGLLALEPPAVDLLLPHRTWGDPPAPGRHGKWLAAVFDRWFAAGAAETRIRFFDELIHLLLGGRSGIETIGLSRVAVLVIETDGALQQVDSLRAAYDGAIGTGLHVDRDPFDRALLHQGVVARQIGVSALADECRGCPVHTVCGAGYYAHRYRPGTGFRNPSVYCHDLEYLIRHVHARLAADLARVTAR